MTEEKRRYMRFNVLADAVCKTGGVRKQLKVKNFSREGLGILSDEMINKGEEVEIEMVIPGDNIPVMLQGEIAWTDNENAGNGLHNMGIQLKKISNDARSKILEYIYKDWMKTNTEK
ncbi:MAG: PilZ domain-containing protein [Candidatus Omnitrophota bacterium]